MFPTSSYYDDYGKVFDRYYPNYHRGYYPAGGYSHAYPYSSAVSSSVMGGVRHDIPTQRQSWTETIAFPRRWVDVTENERVDLIPVQKRYEDYIEIQHETELVPNHRVLRKTELHPYERYHERLEYLPVKSANIRGSLQGDIREGRSVVPTPSLYHANYGVGSTYGGYGRGWLGYGAGYPATMSQSYYGSGPYTRTSWR